MYKYIIGVDAGGTKTHAIVYDLQARMLSEHYSGMGNMNVDAELAISNIKEAIRKSVVSLEGKCFICIGAAGITAKGNKERLQNELQDDFIGHCIEIITDAMLALYANLEGEDGMLLISGTGSVGYAKQGNEFYRVGGWGHILGDDGSGYSISLAAIKQIFNEYDKKQPFSNLSKLIMDNLNAESVYAVVDFVYNSPKSKIASLFKSIMLMADNGADKAINLLNDAAQDLAKMIDILASKTDFTDSINISFSGSVIQNAKILQEKLLQLLDGMNQEYNIVKNSNPSPKGAYYIYKERC